MIKIPTLADAPVAGKRVLVRVDFNVSLKEDQTIANDDRIREAIPTISYLLKKKATPILVSHLGRPKNEHDKKFSLACVAKRLEELLKHPVVFMDQYWKKDAAMRIRTLPAGTLVLCENVRFYPGEEGNDVWFSRQLATLADVFVNDAFGTAHRTHASTVGVTRFLPSYAGFLFSKEVTMLGSAMTSPKRPLLVVIGGGKTPEKIRVIEKLLDIADTVYLGGAVANTFFATWGISVGVSRVDHEMIEMARAVLWKATRTPSRLILPNDVVVSDAARATKPFVLPFDKVPGAMGIFDIGPQAQVEVTKMAREAKTIIWNGPMGMYEDERFMAGTDATFRAIAASAATTIIGGGDTISTIRDETLLKDITHVSTGGSAMLEFMEKGTLPAIEALKNHVKS
ncbi:MAG: Phosphoglycerate kinase [Candidatus Gottesmanbacteria bacterium GW2011_GWA1_48_13]|uniref:Phosphoglycerate kinase n=2 Tax=Candidatus Gottesmaniibacteriota TaxID=1752720 RepID=A0A0G1UQ23_9BACT|nr:MAG: Phosphoglycerate kinase [Candidatus Gottesmanbacteria bacterium GW2011_GWA1_48_13]